MAVEDNTTPPVQPTYQTIGEFEQANPAASPAERLRAQADIIRNSAIPDRSRSALEIAGDYASSIGQGLTSATAGLVTGLGVAATAETPLLQEGQSPSVLTDDPAVASLYNALRSANQPVEDLKSALRPTALTASQAVSEFQEYTGSVLDSEARKGQKARYEHNKQVFQQSPEYVQANQVEKTAMDVKFTTENLLANPLVAEDIGAQGLADLGTSILTAAGVSKAVLKKGTITSAAGPVSPAKTAEKASAVAATVQGSLSEGASSANQVAQDIMGMSHQDLLASEEYQEAYKRTGSEEDAKAIIATRAANETFKDVAVISGIIGKVTGADKAAADLATKGLKSTTKSATKGVASETVEEGTQSATSQVASNIESRIADPNIPALEGVGEQVVSGAVGGALASAPTQATSVVASASSAAAGKGREVSDAFKAKQVERAEATTQSTEEVETPEVNTPEVNPVQEQQAPIQEAAAPIIEATEPSPAVVGVQDTVRNLQEGVGQINELVSKTDLETADVGQLLEIASSAENATAELAGQVSNALADPNITEQERYDLTKLSEQITKPQHASITGSLNRAIKRNPAIGKLLDEAFEATTTGDTTRLDAYLGATEEAGKTPVVRQELTNALLQTALYSRDMASDPNVSSDQLRQAATKATGEVKQQLEAAATLKDIDTVSAEVTDGAKEFTGINTHLQNLQEQVATGADTTQTVEQLNSFLAQRGEKAAALEAAISQAEQPDAQYPIRATWGQKGTWSISSPRSLERTRQLAEQVRKEEQLVGEAVQAADTIIQGNPIDEPTTEPVADTTGVESDTPSVDTTVPTSVESDRAYVETVSQNTELQTPERVQRAQAQFDEAARQDAIDTDPAVFKASGEVQGLETSLQNLRDIQTKQQELAERTGASSAYQNLDQVTQDITRTEGQLAQARTRLTRATERATTQFEYDQLDWDLGSDASSPETPSGQLKSLAKNMLNAITGKKAIAAIEGQYADYELNLSNPKSVAKFVRNQSTTMLTNVVNFVNEQVSTKADRAMIDKLVGTSKSIATAPATLINTLGSLRGDFTGKFDLGLDNTNRFKDGVIAYRDSKLWSDTDYLGLLSNIDPNQDIKVQVQEAGLDVSRFSKHDTEMLKLLANKRNWFADNFNQLASTLVANLDRASISDFDRNKLRFLLDENGQFPAKVVDAAFMSYMNTTDVVSKSFYNDNRTIMGMMGLSDESQIGDIPELAQLRSMGAGISSAQLGRAFKQAMALNHTGDIPQSVTDSVYSGMGGMLLNVMKTDPELIPMTVRGSFGEFTGFTLRTQDTVKQYAKITGQGTQSMQYDNNFMAHKNDGSKLLSQISEPEINEPDNYIGQKPPKATNQDTHIRSTDTLTDEQVEAENIYREFAHEVDPTVATFHRAIGLQGYQTLKGYDPDTELLNAEHRLAVEGKNQEIMDSYEKADKLLNQLDESDNKDIYFTSAFSSVRRQQMRGAVNPQGNKYHRILIGHKKTAKVGRINMRNLTGMRKGSDGYNFILALGQAYGFKVDKQDNHKSFIEMANKLEEIINQESTGEGLYAMLTDQMDSDGNFFSELTPETIKALKAETKGSDHHIQGVLTVARLLRKTSDGTVTNFKHHMRAEVDGLTNGPAHSTWMNGLAGLSQEEQIDALSRGGYLVGDGTGNNTHVQIGQGRITDFYLTVADVANSDLDLTQELLKQDANEGDKFAQTLLDNYKFLGDKGVAIAAEYDDNGEVVSIKVTRNGTKNPVTVTVYGGGATGIHAKMAAEIRDLFAERLTELSEQVSQGKINRAALNEELQSWSKVFYNSPKKLQLIRDVKGAKGRKGVAQAIRDFTFDSELKEKSVKNTGRLYGKAITDSIDTVFEPNKRSASLMNAGMNFITATANDTFTRAYKALHAKRVEEGTIREYDTLPAKDVGMLQRKLQDAFPFLKTAIQDYSNVSTRGEGRVADAGIQQVRYPTMNGKSSQTDIDHSTKSMGLPGVRSIPVLTISIDGAVQTNNHLLQGNNQNYLNVLDAIDRVADKGLRASNELFNVAEYMGIMTADTLGSVQTAVLRTLQAQTNTIEFEGISIDPILKVAPLDDADARLELSQEELRQSVKDITAPIANELGLNPLQIGDVDAFLGYLVKQLEVERTNNQLARDNFVFGNTEVAINQMAGIDDGHAKVVNGQVVLSDEAKALMTDEALGRVNTFNAKMKTRYENFINKPDDALTEMANTELEELRKRIQQDPMDVEARMEADFILRPLQGLWTDMRGSFDLDSNEFTYTLTGSNLTKFKKALSPDIRVQDFLKDETATAFNTDSAIPSLGSRVSGILASKDKAGRDYLDKLLKDVEIKVTSDLPEGVNGQYYSEKRGNKVKRVIKIRAGLTTNKANVVLAHELIHGITQGGIAKGIDDRANKVKSKEADFVADLYKQMARSIRFMEKQADTPASYPMLKDLYESTKSGDSAAIELALNEYIAIVGSEMSDYSNFLSSEFEAKGASKSLRDSLRASLKTLRKWLQDTFGYRADVKAKLAEPVTVSEQDALAQIVAGLGDNQLTKLSDDKNGKYVLNSSTVQQQELNSVQKALRNIEGQLNNTAAKGANMVIDAVLSRLPQTQALAGNKAAQKEFIQTEKRNILQGDPDGGRTSVWRSTFGEFFARDSEHSKELDALNDRAKHDADTKRETTKKIVSSNIDDNLGVLSDADNKAVLNVAIRGDIYSLTEDVGRLTGLLDNPNALEQSVQLAQQHIQSLQGATTNQKNLMINEALALGYRMVHGGATDGFNLPNAKAIVNMSATGFQSVKTNTTQFEKAVDELASLAAMRYSDGEDRANLSALLKSNPDGVKYAADQHKSTQAKLIEQHGKGREFTLPKGFVNEQRTQQGTQQAIKVVPWSERKKVKGYTLVRPFLLDDGTKMALIQSKEGGNPPYVQGAMSTIESAIGGFTTTYGSATDKALPSVLGEQARSLSATKAKKTRAYASNIREPRPMTEGLVPHINALGKVQGYRYVLSNQERKELLDITDNVADTLSAYAARAGEEQIAQKYNTELVSALHKAYQSIDGMDVREGDFVKVHADSTDPEIAQIWRVIPQHTKKEISKVFGENALYVHKRDLDNALGYREWSISSLWNQSLEPGSNKAMFVDLAESLLGDNAVNKIRWAERTLQSAVTDAKDLIVIKSIVVPLENLFSNATHLLMSGVSAKDIVKDSKIAIDAVKKYREDEEALLRAIEHEGVTGEDMSETVRRLELELETNPVANMIQNGLLPSVTDDVRVRGELEDKYGIFERIPFLKKLDESDNFLVDVGKNIVITKDSATYKALSWATEMGDFTAKFTLFNHLVRNEGMTEQEALDKVRVEFINYNTLTNKQLDYLNKVGGVNFFKYFSRIQSVMFNAIKKNPTRALMTFIGADTVGTSSIFDAMWLGKDITATTGAYDLINMAGTNHPYFGN